MNIQSRVKKIINYLYNILIKHSFNNLDLSSSISSKATFYGAKGISIGRNVNILPNAILSCTFWNTTKGVAGSIEIGEFTSIEPYAFLWSCGGNIKIGRSCSVNSFCMIYGHGGLEIGNFVRIATHTVIIPSNHVFSRTDIPIYKQGNLDKGIKIEDDVWIGSNATILDGVIIKEGCVIGAGSVVTRSTDPYGVYAGVPARRIKNRSKETNLD